jgi:glucosamine kinase
VAYFLGIDGGGSKTTCVVGDDVSQLAMVTTGPSNIIRVGDKRAREALRNAIIEACADAKINPQEVGSACIGIAGAGREEVAVAVRKIVGELITGDIEVVGDMPIALEAAFGAGPGVVVIAGTGSFAYGRDAQGRTVRAGGWGFAVSDEGSAHWIGRVAVSNLLRAIDQQEDRKAAPDAPLLREMMTAWKLKSFDELVRTANSNPDFATLFPAVLTTGEGGDSVAQNVLTKAGRELAQLAAMVSRRLFAQNDVSLSAVGLALAGGVFRHSQKVRDVFYSEIQKENLPLRLDPQIVEPVMGALRVARKRGRN